MKKRLAVTAALLWAISLTACGASGVAETLISTKSRVETLQSEIPSGGELVQSRSKPDAAEVAQGEAELQFDQSSSQNAYPFVFAGSDDTPVVVNTGDLFGGWTAQEITYTAPGYETRGGFFAAF